MKPWRPEEGWDAQLIVYHTPIAYKTGEYQADRDISMVEAGADAMLEGLRKNPLDLEQLRIFCKYVDVPLNTKLISFKGVKGKVVFIPDEE